MSEKSLDYRIGLDIGTNSIGWAVIELEYNEVLDDYEKVGIVDLNVRMFDKAEIPKTGASLAEPRRLARSTRRRLRRKRERKQKIKDLLLKYDVLNEREMEQLYKKGEPILDIWTIRVEGLDRLLSQNEWARLLIHLAQRRGFKSNRKSELKEKDLGVVLSSIKENSTRLKNYRTVGEMWVKDEFFQKLERRRNTSGEYVFTVSRTELEEEIKTLFQVQRELNSPYASEKLEEEYLKIWNHQLPFASGNAILKRVGHCSIERTEKRIPKATYTFQYFMVLDKLNRLRLGEKLEPLSREQVKSLIDKIFNPANLKRIPKIKYSDIRKWLSLDETVKFNDILYDPEKSLANNEKLEFVNLKSYFEIKQKCDAHEFETYTFSDYDAIGFALTVYKTDKDIKQYLKNPNNLAKRIYDDQFIESILSLSYTKFGHLSLKVLKNIIPKMEEGLTFKEAADELGYDTTGLNKVEKKSLLPTIPDDITNPVVKRALTQARKVVNAIIKKYESQPISIHIELAREISKTFEERNKIRREITGNYERNKGAISNLVENGVLNPKGYDIVKYKLWVEQNRRCAYSLNPIPPETFYRDLLKGRNEASTLEVDHIIPYSKSFMDSYHNKVLVYADENRKKGNQLPYEYLSSDQARWKKFEEYVLTTDFSKRKKNLLLKKSLLEQEVDLMKDRHLNDTRYASRFLKNFIELNLQMKASKKKNHKKRVETVNGQVTAHLRKRWGLEKHRDETYLHHALDAVVVACTDSKMVKKVTEYHKGKENSVRNNDFPLPWDEFRDELLSRLSELPNPEQIKNALESNTELPSYMLVSRMSRRSVTGAAHKETISINGGIDERGKTILVKKLPLEQIKFDKNGDFKMFNKESDLATYHAIKERYLQFNNSKEAFKEPLYKPCKKGKPNQIKRVKVEVERKSFVRNVNGGVSENGDLVRIDIFKKDGKYAMIPIYVIDTVKDMLPNKIVTSGRGYEQWKELDDTYEFQFSLHPYELVRVQRDQEDKFLYFNTIDIDGNRIIFREPNVPHKQTDRRYSLGTIDLLEKYEVDVLSRVSLVKKEKRRSFHI